MGQSEFIGRQSRGNLASDSMHSWQWRIIVIMGLNCAILSTNWDQKDKRINKDRRKTWMDYYSRGKLIKFRCICLLCHQLRFCKQTHMDLVRAFKCVMIHRSFNAYCILNYLNKIILVAGHHCQYYILMSMYLFNWYL